MEIFAAVNLDGRYQITVEARYKGVEWFAVVEVVVKDQLTSRRELAAG